MKKKVVLAVLIGSLIGFAISVFITIFISLSLGDGAYHAAHPKLIEICENEISAVILQAVCALLYGGAWGGASMIWQSESLSLMKKTVLHLVIVSVSALPIAYFMWWMPHSLWGVLGYFGIFFGIYLIIWLCLYFSIKRRIKRINEKISQNEA
ncbi:MAG: DUF3021 domain-containing protein [Clostridia bacterium]|nr:DUF3021 domain-containing protein [Clostridia bacterium]